MHASSASNQQQPHRPGPLHQTNKTHKGGRHTRKSSSATSEIKNKTIFKPTWKVRREERLNQADQSRKLKRDRVLEEKRKVGTESQPPLLVGVLDLNSNSCLSFFEGLKKFNDASALSVKPINDRTLYVVSNRLKMRFKLIALDSTKFDETLDNVRSLDLLILLHKLNKVDEEKDFDTSHLLRAIHIHCLPSIIHVLDALNDPRDGSSFNPTAKQLISAKRILRSKIKGGEEEKMQSVERSHDYLQLFNIIGNCKRKRSQFKNARATVVCDKAEIIGDSLTVLGYVRNKLLSPNDLVHIVGYDDYQIKQIDILPDIVSLRPLSVEGSQVVQTLKPNPMKQETLEQENDLDPMEGEQTWPTAEELAAEAERLNTKKIIKKLPVGTSDYQGAWILEDEDAAGGEVEHSESSDEDGDRKMKDIIEEDEEENLDGGQDDDNGDEDDEMDQESSANKDAANVAMDVEEYDKNNSRDKEMKILEKLREARLDEMFPDEIDTPSDMTARARFARFRGLKSFRTSPWDPQENLPPEYSKIFQFQNFQQTKRRVLNEESREEGADPGQYVRVHLADVPEEVASSILSKQIPPTLVGLLKYERKMTVMNLLVKRLPDSNLNNPIKSKDELIFYVGFRKFKARPLFSNHSISSKFKYERFLRDDVAMVATMFAPITFPPAPVLVFRTNYRGEQELVASGSVLDSNPNRLIVKRMRLSGHPFKIHSKTAVIRFMFFNSEDVQYFKPVELTTKYSRRGHILEPLGTHGHMKCNFDKKIRSDDCVFMNLYKRVFPKWNYKPILG